MAADNTILPNGSYTGLPVATSYGAGTMCIIADPTVTTEDPSGTDLAISPANLVKGAFGTTQNQFIATPNGSTGAIVLRAFTLADLPTQSNQTILSNISGGSAVPSANGLSAILDNVYGSTQGGVLYRGAAAWSFLSPGTAGYVLKTGGAGVNPSWIPGRMPIATVTGAGTAVANTAAETSIFSGATIGLGSLTIPANRLQLGTSLGFYLWGDFGTTSATPNITMKVKLGSSIINTGVTPNISAGYSGKAWMIYASIFNVQSVGASGTIAGYAITLGMNTSNSSAWGNYMTTAGGGAASSPVTIDTTSPLTFDLTAQWSAASASNSIRLLGGTIWLDG